MKKLIIYLVRKRLGLKKNECFRFTNQKNPSDQYFFGDDAVFKRYFSLHWGWVTTKSSVSLNWLLDDECEIEKVEDNDND